MTKKTSKMYGRCKAIDPNLIIELDIKDVRLLKRMRTRYPFAEIIVKTQDGYPVMIERVTTKDSLTES